MKSMMQYGKLKQLEEVIEMTVRNSSAVKAPAAPVEQKPVKQVEQKPDPFGMY